MSWLSKPCGICLRDRCGGHTSKPKRDSSQPKGMTGFGGHLASVRRKQPK